MNRSSLRRPTLVLLLSLLPAAAQLACSKKVTFRFEPPVDKTFIQTLVQTKVMDLGAGKKRIEGARATSRLRFDKSPEGYTLTETIVTMQMQRNGLTVEDPTFSALEDLVVTLHLDTQGNIVSIEGYEKLENIFREALPPGTFAAVSKLFNAETMIAREEAEWAGRVTDFVGRTVKAGEAWASKVPYTLPTGGEIDFFTVTEFAGKTECGEQDCWEIDFRYNSDATALGKEVQDLVNNLAQSVGAKETLQMSGTRIVGNGKRVVDPETMLIYSEKTNRTITMENAGSRLTMQEKTELTLQEEPATP